MIGITLQAGERKRTLCYEAHDILGWRVRGVIWLTNTGKEPVTVATAVVDGARLYLAEAPDAYTGL